MRPQTSWEQRVTVFSNLPGVDLFLSRLKRVKSAGPGQWTGLCPAHDDTNSSLSATLKSARNFVFHCHAGCPPESVLAAVGLTWKDILPPREETDRVIAATYDYKGEEGELLFQVVRFVPKDFRQRRPDGNGGWRWKLGNTRRVLYRLPELLAADPQTPVLVVEGEKDADRLAELGYVATCNSGGAGKWREEYGEGLAGHPVIVIPDADTPGRGHAQAVAAALSGVASTVAVLELPGAKDASAFFDQGGTTEQLDQLLAEAPPFSPDTEGAQGEAADRLETSPLGFPSPTWRKSAQILRGRPPVERIRTGIEPLDQATRGGLPVGVMTLIQGPPGSAKTTLAAQIGLHAAREEGAIVVAMFIDEGILAASIRQGQQLGLDIRALEEGDPETLIVLEQRLAEIGFFIVDPDETTLEAEIRNLTAAPPGHKRMLIVDSAHVVPCERAKNAQSGRAQIDAVVSVARAGALELPAHVIMTGEVTKGSYSHKDDSENTAELAASADTRKLAYASRLIINLKEEGERIFKVTIPKNTPGLGVKPTFRLELDPARALLAHIQDAEADKHIAASKDAAEKTAVEEAKARVHKTLRLAREHGEEWLSTSALRKKAGGRAETVDKAAEQFAADRIVDRDDRGRGKGIFWRLPEPKHA